MERIKVLNKKFIIEALKHRNYITYNNVYGNIYLRNDGEILGVVRFNTLMKLIHELNLTKYYYGFLIDGYRMEGV